jgi:hypothetical protein
MHRSRRSSLTGVAHHIAMRIQEISEPFISRREEPPKQRLADEFKRICKPSSERLATPLSGLEVQMLADKFVPKSIVQKRRMHQRRLERTAA